MTHTITYKPIYKPKDEAAQQFIDEVIEAHFDGRSKAVKEHKDALVECLASLFAYQGAPKFKVHKRLLKPDQAIAWEAAHKALTGVILRRESGKADYSIKPDVIPSDVIVINQGQRGINYRVEGKGVQWNNLSDMEPSLVSLICGVYAAKVTLETVDQTFEFLIQEKALPVRWTTGADLKGPPISKEAVKVADTYAEWLNAYLERHGYIMGVKRVDNGIMLVCANDVVPNLADILANISLRFFQKMKLPQVSFPMTVDCGNHTSTQHGRPLTQLRKALTA
jgi:hypothetical protein